MDRYRLAPVLDVRTRDEQRRRGDLAAVVGDARATAEEVAVAAARVTTGRTALAQARSTYLELVATGTSPALLALADRYIARRRRDLDTALAEHLRREATHAGQLDQLDGARGRLVHARGERQVIERHFARWRATQQQLADRRED